LYGNGRSGQEKSSTLSPPLIKCENHVNVFKCRKKESVMRGVGKQWGRESVSKIPPRGRRVGGRRLGFERRREEVCG